MSLEVTINNDLKQAMLNKDKRKLEALRAIKSALLLIKTGKDINSVEIPETLELQTLQKLVKQRKESAIVFQSQNRHDLADEELYQAGVIETYLPKQMSREEIIEELNKIISDLGATSPKDMGKVMGKASAHFTGKADNKLVAELVKTLLN